MAFNFCPFTYYAACEVVVQGIRGVFPDNIKGTLPMCPHAHYLRRTATLS